MTQGGAWPVSAPSPAPTLAIQAASYHQTPDLITHTRLLYPCYTLVIPCWRLVVNTNTSYITCAIEAAAPVLTLPLIARDNDTNFA